MNTIDLLDLNNQDLVDLVRVGLDAAPDIEFLASAG